MLYISTLVCTHGQMSILIKAVRSIRNVVDFPAEISGTTVDVGNL